MVPFRSHLAGSGTGARLVRIRRAAQPTVKIVGGSRRDGGTVHLFRQPCVAGFLRKKFPAVAPAFHLGLFLGLILPALTARADSSRTLDAWLAAQAELQSWSADFQQTRTLKTLTEPLVTPGRVWFAAPNQFRWELGQPAQSIAVRQADQMLVIYPRLKRAERYPLATDKPAPWQEMLSLLEAGFPRSRDALESQFRILSVTSQADQARLSLQPRSAGARRMVSRIEIVFATHTHALVSTELIFADGSSMRNDFSNAKINPSMDEAIFAPQLEAGYKITEPFKR